MGSSDNTPSITKIIRRNQQSIFKGVGLSLRHGNENENEESKVHFGLLANLIFRGGSKINFVVFEGEVARPT